MKHLTLSFLLVLLLCSFTLNQKPAYVLFTANGKTTTWEKLLKEAEQADVILFGELHNNPVSHWLQLELANDLLKSKGHSLKLGAEMFEADDQLVLNEYLSGKMTEKTFKDEAKLWNNYATDYKPLVELAKKNKLTFVATNIPRRYANLVYSKGTAALDSISPEAKLMMAPLPFPYDGELKAYKEIFEAAQGHGGENLPKSQAIKDATMAHFILKNLNKGEVMLHLNGAYHSNHRQGIAWYLQQYRPGIKILTISTTEEKNPEDWNKENEQVAEYIICVPETMTKTY
jgi:uncharacterized iron-regulated protein